MHLFNLYRGANLRDQYERPRFIISAHHIINKNNANDILIAKSERKHDELIKSINEIKEVLLNKKLSGKASNPKF